MTELQWVVAVGVAGWIFTAGGLLTWARMSIKQLEKDAMFRTAELREEIATARRDLYRDLNGVGSRVRTNEETAARRYHNLSMSLVIAAPQSKETELCGLLREGT